MAERGHPPLWSKEPLGSGWVALHGIVSVTRLRRRATIFRDHWPEWNHYGVSGTYAADDTEADALMNSAPLERFPKVAFYDPSLLIGAGVSIHPTFRRPHLTIASRDIEQLITALTHTPHEVRKNDYYQR